MSATVYYDSVNELAILTTTFTSAAGAPTDPTTVTCTITDPSGTAVVHTYGGASPADITRVSAGMFTLAVVCFPAVASIDGLWGGAWNATGIVQAFQPVTWRVLPAAVSQIWYVGLAEMKNRLGITDDTDDSDLINAIAASSGWLNEYCGRHFNRVTETRTFVPQDIYELRVDDIVPGAAITLKVDFDGDGIYEQTWAQGTDYQLYLGKDVFNTGSTGIQRPFEKIRVINSGVTFPYLWPLSPVNRVQIMTTWGWPQVPWQVPEANKILAADLFKFKDAPFGVAGVSDIGVMRIQSNPWLVELLRPYVRPRRKVGV